MNKIYEIIITTFFLTIILFNIPNKSNFNKYYIIPLTTLLLVKYIVGDIDKGYIWTQLDIMFVLSVFITSIFTIYLLN
jgi:hypothetical protein|tara:strand:- start:4146 stop:4379 length:234 start_codon:yes stop_codon:yes gene_type:complete